MKERGLAGLIVASVAVVILIFVFFARNNIHRLEEAMVESLQDQLLLSVRSEAKFLTESMQDFIRELKVFSEDALVQDLLLKETPSEGPAREMVEVLLEHVFKEAGAPLSILDAQGRLLVRYPAEDGHPAGRDYSQEPDVQLVLQDRRVHLMRVLDRALQDEGRMKISICIPVLKKGELLGVVRATVSPMMLQEKVAELKFLSDSYFHLIDDQLVVLVSPVRERIGQNIVDMHVQQHKDFNWDSFLSVIDRMQAGEEGVGVFLYPEMQEGRLVAERKLTAFAPIRLAQTQWSLGIVSSYKKVSGPIKAYSRNLFIATEFLILLLIGISYFINHSQKESATLQAEVRSAGELKAINQQLRANEQQLKAANQQLRDSERQMKVANEQLQANEQQLRAFNAQIEEKSVQLEKSEQELAQKLRDLEKRNKVMMGREMRIIELKEEIDNLKKRLGQD